MSVVYTDYFLGLLGLQVTATRLTQLVLIQL